MVFLDVAGALDDEALVFLDSEVDVAVVLVGLVVLGEDCLAADVAEFDVREPADCVFVDVLAGAEEDVVDDAEGAESLAVALFRDGREDMADGVNCVLYVVLFRERDRRARNEIQI